MSVVDDDVRAQQQDPEKVKDKDEIIAELTAQVAELKYVVAMTPGNVYWKSMSGHYLGSNNNLAKMLHLPSADAIIGQSDHDLLDPATAAHVIAHDADVLHRVKEKIVEEIGIDIEKKPAIYLTRKTPLYDLQGKIKGLIGISFDITDRKQMEEKLLIAKQKAETANRAKTQFLATISHELRTPLTSILGFASMLDQVNTDPAMKKEYTQHIINSGAYLLSLINSLLDFNKLETNKYEFVQLPLNLKELAVDVINMLTGTATLKKLPLILDYDPQAPEQVMSNNRALRQILINLVGNAIKFTDHGQVSLSIKCVTQTKSSAQLRISVRDTGPGIPVKEHNSIFRRFYQTGSVYTRNTNYTGTGLGLAIVKKLVKLIGGKIAVNSSPEEGSEFYFTADFPIVSLIDTPWLPYAATVKILVVQDENAKSYINTLLANSFYDTVTPKEAVNQLLAAHQGRRPYDVVMFNNSNSEIGAVAIAIAREIKDHNNLQQLLMLLTEVYPTPEEREIFKDIILKPAALDVRIFQLELKLCWEKWQLQRQKQMLEPIKLPQNPHVLLVEDNLLIQIIHKAMLEDLGCTVSVTDSAQGTFEKLSNHYDMSFVDIGLPDMAGFELISKIRAQDKRLASIPIVVITGYSEEEERRLCLRMGANEVVVKPVDKTHLKKLLDQFIR